MSKLDLRKLRAFVTVVEEGSISRAAERLFIQQPPLSRLLQGLEQDFGVPLLVRQPRGVVATDAGSVLLQEARALLSRADQLEAAMQRAAQGKQGSITVGFTSSSALHSFVPEVLRRYREIYPTVSTQLEEAGSTELLQGVLAQRIDLAFVRMPVHGMPELKVERVLQEPMLVALPARHRLATLPRDEPISLKILANEPFVLYRRPAGQGLYDAILAACFRAGFSPQIVQEAPRLTSCLSLVGAGLGVSIVPQSITRLGGEGMVFLPLVAQAQLSAPLYLARREDSDASAIINTFCELLRTQLIDN
ncbi:DNA-binding transcriptional LysR family regulator [Ewingella americana]|uniref:LysR family transcriptional regulator n=1 Tax=Ewingella americana (strain ATCC 33852 / DSM 4580 / CCUG 14506 / JCM 5911 / LMG 7869 / NCTC 12157 / CDC 1468-78) TaxID=910964 RepID=A0A085GHJ0_EWIA3|nr:LysR family transcriptional regulator [Ewingella americana]KAA8729378.1 LysR family transcriptional regulator [Ewingella americana]KFC83185.1 LysR family transcriptional regulator [Ewingella americana ATCC 33852]PKB88728.1 LysR family transcriptional regulator [Ewingella americana]